MKLLYLKTVPFDEKSGGGSITHTIGMINGLLDAGVDIKVLGETQIDLIRAPQEQIDLPPFVNIPYLGNYLYAKRMKKGVKSWLANQQEAFDVVYGRYTMFNDSLITLKKAKNCKLIVEFNSFQSDSFRDIFIATAKKTHNKIIVGFLQLLAPFVKLVINHYENRILSHADYLITVSQILKEDLIKRKHIAAEKILVLPNGVDPNQFCYQAAAGVTIRDRYYIPTANTVIGFAGTFGNWHGIPELTEAFHNIATSNPNVSFLVMGKGALLPQMQRQLADFPQVHFTGLIPYAEMPDYFSACNILVISNSWNPQNGGRFFGSPTKLFEYMSMGRAIVASDLEQIQDVLQNEETALLYRTGDANSLTAALQRLINDSDLQLRLGRNARECAIQVHTWEENGRQVLRLISDK